MPRGGRRAGSGPKPKLLRLPQRPAPGPSPLAPDAPPPAPRDLSAEARAAWRRLAPHAAALGTLAPDTAPGFRLLCELVPRVTALERRIDREGWTVVDAETGGQRAHPLWSTYCKLRLRLEYGYSRFLLIPDGRPVARSGGRAGDRPNPWAGITRPSG